MKLRRSLPALRGQPGLEQAGRIVRAFQGMLLAGLLALGSSPVTAAQLDLSTGAAPAVPAAQLVVCPASLGFGETIQCSISAAYEQDTYSFSVSAGDTVLVKISTSSGNLWPGVAIYSGAVDLCHAEGVQSTEIASCTLAGGGTYGIRVQDTFDGTFTGDYDLFLQRLNNPGSTTAIAFGQTLPGSILVPAQADTYTFTAAAGDKVLLQMTNNSGGVWPGMRVYDAGGVKLCEAGAVKTAGIASCTLPAAGSYAILVYDSFNGVLVGDYDLYLQRLNNPGNTTAIAFGQTLTGSILTPAQMDTYTFSANPGDLLLLRMGTSSGNLWPGVRVYDHAGASVCAATGVASLEIAGCSLAGGGTYSILVYDSYENSFTGNYALYIQRLNNPANAIPFGFGQTLTGSILTPAQMDTYTFTVNAGDTLLVRMLTTSGSFWAGIRIYAANGTLVTKDSSYTFATAGQYSLLAYDSFNGVSTGSYGIFMQRLNNPGNATPVDFGQTTPGSFLLPVQMDTYTFSGNPGDKVLLRMGRASGSFFPGLLVYDPAGVQICAKYSGITAEIASCALATAGTYTILAYDAFEGSGLGDFGLYLQRLNQPGGARAIARGTATGGSILSPAQMGTFTFSIPAADTVSLKIIRLANTFQPGLRVYAPDGSLLCEGTYSDSTQLEACALPGSGSYTLLVYDSFNGTLTGRYSVYLDCCKVYLPLNLRLP
jgi:hypothetical protein